MRVQNKDSVYNTYLKFRSCFSSKKCVLYMGKYGTLVLAFHNFLISLTTSNYASVVSVSESILTFHIPITRHCNIDDNDFVVFSYEVKINMILINFYAFGWIFLKTGSYQYFKATRSVGRVGSKGKSNHQGHHGNQS